MLGNRSLRPTGEPRLLYRVAAPDGDDGSTMLSAWAGCCALAGDDGAGWDQTGWVAIGGELDRYSASLLRDPLLDYAAYAGELVIDLQALEFIDSAGVELLEETTRHQLARGGFVRLHEPQPFVRKVMRLVAEAEIARKRPLVSARLDDPDHVASTTRRDPCRSVGARRPNRHTLSLVLDGQLHGRRP